MSEAGGPAEAPTSPATRLAADGEGHRPAGRPCPVRARGLGFRYPGGRAGLHDLDLDVDEGETVVALGPNGSGKSTLLRLLATDLRPGSGDLTLLGAPARSAGPALRRRIGWVPDAAPHFPWLTGRENARVFLELAGGGTGTARLDRLLEDFALSDVADVPVARYSFGMRRKLLLVETLAAAPDLLLLDEPSVGLDPPAVAALRSRLAEAASGGAAVVLATNEVREVPEWGDRVLFLHRGRVVRQGTPAELRRSVEGRTHIEIRVHGEPPSLPALEGIEIARAAPDRVVAESRDEGRCLPLLLEALQERGARVREVRVRPRDLGDLFEALTGEPMAEGDGPP